VCVGADSVKLDSPSVKSGRHISPICASLNRCVENRLYPTIEIAC